MIPARAAIWAQLVQAPSLFARFPPRHGRCTALDVDAIYSSGNLTPMSAPFRVFDFDFYRVPPGGRSAQMQVPAHAEGTVHGVVLWWRTELDAAGCIAISTAPGWVDETHEICETHKACETHEACETCEAHETHEACEASSTVYDGDDGCGGPVKQQWREHWQPCWFAIAEGIPVAAGV